MLTLVPESIEKYAEEHSLQESAVLKALAKETWAKQPAAVMQVGRLEGAFLKLMVQISGAKRVLEIGTFTGYSALAMAEGLPANGKLITCDINPETTAVAKRYWARSPHGKKIELRLGKGVETLKTLKGPFDLVFIDANKADYEAYWEACLPKVKPGGLILADNVLWSGRVLKPKDGDDKAIVRFNQRVRRDRRVDSVMLTLRDGVTVARKK
jgi:caffeoyl-CoA O-methyltransferase